MEWKSFYGNYEVSTNGDIRNYKTGKLLKSYDSNGYKRIRFKSENVSFLIHRLVLMTFDPIIDPHNYVVNHIDGDPSNNNISNLQWCEQKENIYHSKTITKNGAVISKKKIVQLYNQNKNISLNDFINLLVDNCN